MDRLTVLALMILMATPTNALGELSTGSNLTDASFPLPHFVMNVMSDEVDNYKYIFNMRYISDDNVEVTGGRIYFAVLIIFALSSFYLYSILKRFLNG